MQKGKERYFWLSEPDLRVSNILRTGLREDKLKVKLEAVGVEFFTSTSRFSIRVYTDMTYSICLFWYSLFFCRFTIKFCSGWLLFIYVINQGPLSAMNHDQSNLGYSRSPLLFVSMNHLHHERSLPNETSTAHSCLDDHPSRHAPSLAHLLIKTLRSKRILIDTCEAVRGRLLPLALSSNSGFFCASSFS